MKIVIDSNVLFSALIKNSTTRQIILMYDCEFLFPEYIFQELERYKHILLQKSGLSEKGFDELLKMILSKVMLVPTIAMDDFKDTAVKLVKDIDINDVQFVACTLANLDSILWSNDKRLKEIREIKVLNTSEIISILYDNKI